MAKEGVSATGQMVISVTLPQISALSPTRLWQHQQNSFLIKKLLKSRGTNWGQERKTFIIKLNANVRRSLYWGEGK